MRHILLKDKKITATALKKWQEEDVAFWEKHIGVTPTYEVIDTDYTTYPTYVDEDGDIRPTAVYLQSLNNVATKKVGDYGCDFIIVLIHEDNWRSHGVLWEELKKKFNITKEKGIWGTNFSYIYGKQCLDYCRWDKDNPANSFGTIYHERHHSLDAIIKVELNVDVNPLLGTTKYDAEITHGGKFPWRYIRHKENLDSLKVMAPYLRDAFQKRRDMNDGTINKMQTIITLATKVLYLLRMKANRKDGVPRV